MLRQALLKAFLMGGIDQVAIGAIAPAVIRAAEILGVAGVVIDQPHTAVLAHVVKGLHGAGTVAGPCRGSTKQVHVAGPQSGSTKRVHAADPQSRPM